MPDYALPAASVLYVQNVREIQEETAPRVSLVLNEHGGLHFLRYGAFRGKWTHVATWAIDEVDFFLGASVEESGGGFVGGGFGVDGAAAGIFGAAIANAVSSSRTDWTTLTAARVHESDAEQAVTLGWRDIDEIQLRQWLNEHYPLWIDGWLYHLVATLQARPIDDIDDAMFFADLIWRMNARGLIGTDDRTHLLQVLDTQSPGITIPLPDPEFLRQAGLTESSDGNGGAGPTPPVDLVDQLARLVALHRDGALDDAEFAAAKARLLG